MARRKSNYTIDRGLSVRMFLTGAALLGLYLVIGAVLRAFGIGLFAIVLVEFGMLFAQYWFSDRIAMFSMGAQLVSESEEPELHAMIDRLCQLANMPKPKVGVAPQDIPNAFATGRNPANAAVVVTRGIQRRLSDEELEAVLAHELSHVAHRDVAVMTIASGVGLLAGLISRMAMWGSFLSGDDRENQNAFIMELVVMLVSFVVYIVAYLLTLTLSRYRELSADRSGAILIGKPSALASALIKISGDMATIPTNDLRKVEGMNAFFFTPALAQGSVAALFSTHPPLQKRLDQLARLEREMNA